jgi:hypothetical protein
VVESVVHSGGDGQRLSGTGRYRNTAREL